MLKKIKKNRNIRGNTIAKELINEATDIMVAAVELKNMQSVKIQMMLASQKLETIGAKQRDLRKRLHDHDKKDIPPAKKMKT